MEPLSSISNSPLTKEEFEWFAVWPQEPLFEATKRYHASRTLQRFGEEIKVGLCEAHGEEEED